MAETETESGGGGSNVLTRKLGPIPVWAWMGVGLGIALAYTSIKKNKAAASATAQQSATAATGQLPTMQTASGSTPASLIPQFVNQVFNQESPPVASPQPQKKPPTAPSAISGLNNYVFPGTTNLVWQQPANGKVTSVKIEATPVNKPGWGPVDTVVDTSGMSAGSNTGHMFTIDPISRGVTYDYILTPYNGSAAGPPSTVRVTNA
jgi:hypothetical protein